MSPPTVNSRSAFFASAARIASSPVLTICWASRIQSSPFFARGTSMSRFPDSATVMAALRTAVHSSSVFGRISCEPSLVSIDLTESQMASALGSTTACISSFVSTTGLKGGGAGPPQPTSSAQTPMTGASLRMAVMLSRTHLVQQRLELRHDGGPAVFAIHVGQALRTEALARVVVIEQVIERRLELRDVAKV